MSSVKEPDGISAVHLKQIAKVAKAARAFLKSNDRWELQSYDCSAEECTQRYSDVQAKYRALQREVSKLETMEGVQGKRVIV